MTGFAAIFSDMPVESRDLDAMREAMAYRVSEADAAWQGGHAGLVAKVLHTNAESFECAQPHTSEDGKIALAFDGYLANCEELRRDLSERGAILRNRSDAELALRAYEQWGDDTAQRLEGEFALVVIDLRRRGVYCARDHAGLRPLYFAVQGNRFIASTDLGPVVEAMQPNPSADRGFLAELMAIRVYSGEATPWLGIKRLRQAHSLWFQSGTGADPVIRDWKYWSVPTEVTIRYKRDEDYRDHYLEMLAECIRRASRTHETLAMTVSGGLDSSALFCFADRLLAEGRMQAPEIRGYSLAAKPGSPAYELPYARAAAESVGRQLEEIPLFMPDLEWYRQEAAARRDFPIPTNTAMSETLRRTVVEHGSRAIMGGHGGDEWLQGSAIYFREMVRHLDLGRYFETLTTQARRLGWRQVAPFALRQALLAFIPDAILEPLRRRRRMAQRSGAADLFWLNESAKRRVAEAQDVYLESLPHESMAFLKENLLAQPLGDFGKSYTTTQLARQGLEMRAPMFSRQFIEFSARTPEHIKYRGEKTRFMHRMAMEGILPPTILNREMKAHFPSEGVEQQFADFYEAHGERLLEGIVDHAGVARLLQIYRETPIEEDEWGWEIWGVFGAAAFLLDNENELRQR